MRKSVFFVVAFAVACSELIANDLGCGVEMLHNNLFRVPDVAVGSLDGFTSSCEKCEFLAVARRGSSCRGCYGSGFDRSRVSGGFRMMGEIGYEVREFLITRETGFMVGYHYLNYAQMNVGAGYKTDFFGFPVFFLSLPAYIDFRFSPINAKVSPFMGGRCGVSYDVGLSEWYDFYSLMFGFRVNRSARRSLYVYVAGFHYNEFDEEYHQGYYSFSLRASYQF